MSKAMETVIVIMISMAFGIGIQDEYNVTNKLPQVTIEYVDKEVVKYVDKNVTVVEYVDRNITKVIKLKPTVECKAVVTYK